MVNIFGKPCIFGEAFGQSGAAPLTYAQIYAFLFPTDVAAPISSPYTEGIGNLNITDGSSRLSVSSGSLQLAAATYAAGDPRALTDSLARARGRALVAKVTPAGAGAILGVGFTGGTTITSGYYFVNSNEIRAFDTAGINSIGAWANGTAYQLTVVERDPGALLFIKGGVYTTWTLFYVGKTISTAMTAGITAMAAAAGNGVAIDYLKVVDLPAPFNQQYGLATLNDTTVASGDTFTGTADGHHEFFFTLNGSPSANDEVVLEYRRTDANNCVRAKVKRNAGNTAWDFQVRSVSGGVESTPAGWTDVTGVGTPDMIGVNVVGTTHRFFTKAVATTTKRGATITLSHQDTAAGLGVTAAAGTTLSSVDSWPYTSGTYDTYLNPPHA